MSERLEGLYQAARSALKAKDHSRASDLLRQILLIDENYKDASRLLAQTVKLRRRRWYNDTRLWGALGFAMIVVLGFLITPRMQGFYASQPSATVAPTRDPTATLPSTVIPIATETSLPAPTTVPLVWKRVSMGQEFPRDTVTALAIDPKDSDVLYASMENAGVYKSIDGGLSWRPAFFGLADINVESLLIDFQNTQILYAGTPSGIYKSENGGENWSRIAEGAYLLVDPQDNSHLYARDIDHIYESTDQGKNWEAVYSSQAGCPGKILSWAIHPTDGKTLYLGGGEECERGIYQSDDGGQTWTFVQKVENPPGLELAPWLEYLVVPMDWLAVRLDKGNVIVDYGAASNLVDSTGFVYAYCDPFLCKSRPNGEQGVRLGKPELGIVTVIAISPQDPNTVYVAGKGIAVTKDGGQTWSKLNNGLGGMLLTLETGEGEPPTLYLQQEDCNLNEFQVDGAYDPEKEKEPGQALYISKDGGQTWELAIQTGCYLVKNNDGMTLYRVGQVFELREGATNWTTWLWQSQDGGKSWMKLLTPVHSVVDTVTVQGGVMYLYEAHADEGPSIRTEYISEDYGQKWRRIDPPTDTKLCYGSTLQFIDAYRPMTIDPSNGNHVFVIDNGILLESHDSCDTTKAFATAPNTSMNSVAFDPDQSNTIYAGTDSGAYISTNGGETWNEINDGLLGATVVYSLVVDKDSNVYAATPYGIFKLESK